MTIRRLGEVDKALHRAHAWRLAPLLEGKRLDERVTFNLRSTVTNFLGPQISINPEELMQAEMALIARSWSEATRPVWMVRLTDKAVLKRWFPPRERTAKQTTDHAEFFQTRAGVHVCARDGIVAMSRRFGPESLLRDIRDLMAGRDDDVLERSDSYRELTAYLPRNLLATAYLAREDTASAVEGKHSPWWPTLDRAVIGLFEGEGRIDLAIRASLAAPHPKPMLAPAVINRLLQLPQTTLYASATTIDFDRLSDRTSVKSLPETLGGYLLFLTGIKGTAGSASDRSPGFGPHTIVAWGQDLSEGGSTPQMALMVECSDSGAARDFAERIAKRMIQLVRAIDPEGSAGALTVRESTYLGVPFRHVPLEDYAHRSKLPLVKLLGGAEPAWTVWNRWLIVALTRRHLERILDAQYGLVPTLATVRDVRALRTHPGGRAVVSVVQPDLATDVLNQWLTAQETGAPSLLDPTWWQGGAMSGRKPPRLGIGMKLVQEPGAVVVAKVYPRTPANGQLQLGDRIVGIDGRLLALDSPNADLRTRWAQDTDKPTRTLRVYRREDVLDVTLPGTTGHARWPNVLLKPADAVREFAALGRTLEFASFTVHMSNDTHYSARLTLRFIPTRAGGTTTHR